MPKLRVPSPGTVAKPKKVSRSIHLELSVAEELRTLAEENGSTFNRLAVLAIEFYLDEWRRTAKGKAKP